MNNKDNKNIEIDKILKKCYRHLRSCLIFENLEEPQFICNKLKTIRKLEKDLPLETALLVEKFIKIHIYPILYDDGCFEFIYRKEFGEYDENGNFVINSEESLDMIIYLMYEYSHGQIKSLKQYFKHHFDV